MGCGDGKSSEKIYGRRDFNVHAGMSTAKKRSQIDDASEIYIVHFFQGFDDTYTPQN